MKRKKKNAKPYLVYTYIGIHEDEILGKNQADNVVAVMVKDGNARVS
jgi:hypothetical protein